jgi:hypothetical protein
MWTKDRRNSYFRLFLAAAAFLFTYFLVFRLPFTPVYIEWDHLISVYESARLLHGDVMYRDFFEFTTPGASLFYAALFSVFGEKYYLLSLTIITLAVVSTLLTFELSLRTVTGPLRFIPPLIWLYFGFKWLGLDGSHRMFSPIFVLMAVLAMIKGRTRSHLIPCGILLGLASAFTQQRGFVAALAIAAFFFIETWEKRQPVKRAFLDTFWMFLAFTITLALSIGYFVWAAGVSDFLFDTVVYPLFYYSNAPANGYGVFISDVAQGISMPELSAKLSQTVAIFYVWLLPAALLIGVFTIGSRIRRGTPDEVRAPMLLAVVSFLMFATTVGPNAIRFFQVSVPVIVLLCWLIGQISKIKKMEVWLSGAIAVVLIVLGTYQAIRIQTTWDFSYVDTPSGTLAFIVPEQAKFFSDLKSRTHPGETVYESVQPYIYFPLGLRNPTKMAQVWPYDYTRPEQIAGVIDDLKTSQPELIVWDNSNNKPDDQRTPDDHLGPLADFVNSHYLPTGRVYLIEGHELQVYQRKLAN